MVISNELLSEIIKLIIENKLEPLIPSRFKEEWDKLEKIVNESADDSKIMSEIKSDDKNVSDYANLISWLTPAT